MASNDIFAEIKLKDADFFTAFRLCKYDYGQYPENVSQMGA